MSKRDAKSNSKENLIKLKAPLFFSPSTQKKSTNIIKLNIEPKKVYQQTEYNLSKNKIKQKINLGNINPNSKLFLKKNMTQNISALNFTENNMAPDNKVLKNILNNNIKFNIGRSSHNFLNSKNSAENLKKNAASEYELLANANNENNFLKKPKGKNIIKLNNINPIGFIYSTQGNDKNNEAISPPHVGMNPKIIFLKNEKQIQSTENIIDEEEKKEGINCLLRNTFTNVKIYPTTFLNNKIIFQNVDKNNKNINNNENNLNTTSENSNTSTMKHNSSKIKKEKIVIDTEKHEKPNEKFQSMEELHYFYVDMLQKGKNYIYELDKCKI